MKNNQSGPFLGQFEVQQPSGKFKLFWFTWNDNTWSAGFGFPYMLMGENTRAGVRFSKTRAYVCVDESDTGGCVTETWVIKNLSFAPEHTPQMMGKMTVGKDGTVKQNPDKRGETWHVHPVGKPQSWYAMRGSKAAASRLANELNRGAGKIVYESSRASWSDAGGDGGVKGNPLVRVKIKSPPQRPAGNDDAPSKRLVKRRKTTARAPRGVWANPLTAKQQAQFKKVYAVHLASMPPHLAISFFTKKSDAIEAAHGVVDRKGVPVKVSSVDQWVGDK